MLELMPWNISLFRMLNDARHPLWDMLMGTISGLGDGLVVALCCAILCMYYLRLGVAATLAFIISGILAQAIKRHWDMPRPPALLEHVHVLGSALQSHSFPSGHATSDGVMVVLAVLLWKKTKDWRFWGMFGLFLLAAYGRIYGGVHFPVDVLVGLSLGALCMYGFHRWSLRWDVAAWQQSARYKEVVGLIVLIEAAVLGLGYHIQPATAKPLTLLLPVLALLLLRAFWKKQSPHES